MDNMYVYIDCAMHIKLRKCKLHFQFAIDHLAIKFQKKYGGSNLGTFIERMLQLLQPISREYLTPLKYKHPQAITRIIYVLEVAKHTERTLTKFPEKKSIG